jgi:glutamate 5-kinase
MLLSKSDMEDVLRKERVKDILLDTMNHDIVPILNENDVVSLNSFSGNDFLAAEIAKLIQADSLLLLTDVEGVYDKSMQVITKLSQNYQELAPLKKQHKKNGVGGITGKIIAARIASNAGVATYISSGRRKNVLSEMILKNKHIGTQVL